LIFPLDEYLSPSSRQSCSSLLPLPGIELIFSIDQSVVGSSMTALDFSKPQFDLVQPTGISGRVMERNFGGDQRETVRLLESLCAEIVTNDVDLLAFGLIRYDVRKKCNKLGKRYRELTF